MLISWLVLILQEFRYNFSAALLGVVLLGGGGAIGRLLCISRGLASTYTSEKTMTKNRPSPPFITRTL